MALNPLPTITGTQRKVTATLTASTGPINVTFPVFGDETDLVVTLGGTQQSGNWSFTSPSGSIATLPKPITDGRVTFSSPVTGVVEVIGRRIPKRLSNLPENAGPTVRDINYIALENAAVMSELFFNGGSSTGGGGGGIVGAGDVVGLDEFVQDQIGGKVKAGAGISVAYNDATGETTITNTGGGGGGGGGPVAASDVSFTPTGGIAAVTVQNALAELDSETVKSAGLNELVDDRVGDLLKAGTNISLVYNDAANTLTINATSGGSSLFCTPESFGAVGNGIADDTAALALALRDPRPCLLVGQYRITANIPFGTTYTAFKVVMGSGGKHILLDAATAGLTWTTTTPDVLQEHMLIARDFTIVSAVSNHSVAALQLTTTGGSGATTKTFQIENVNTFGASVGTACFIGIGLQNQRGGQITNCTHQGNRNEALTLGVFNGYGVYMDGTGDPVEVDVVGCRAYCCLAGVGIWQTHEGVNVDRCVTVATGYGVFVQVDENPMSGDNEGKPLFRVTNCHHNNHHGGVVMVRARDFCIMGNDFLAWTPNSNWIGIQATVGGATSQYGYISGNRIQDATTVPPSSGLTIGVRLDGVATGGLFTIVGENRYVNLKRGLSLESNARYVQYSTGSIYAACTQDVVDLGSLNSAYGGGGGGGGMTDAQLLARANHTGNDAYGTTFAKAGGAGGGGLRLQAPDSTSLSAAVGIDVATNTLRFYENGGSFRGAGLDLASCGGSISTSIVTDLNIGNFMAGVGVGSLGTFALMADAIGGSQGATVSGSSVSYAYTAGTGGPTASGTWRRHGWTPGAGHVTMFQRVA